MFDGSETTLDITTLIVGVAIVIMSVALAQLVLMGIAAVIQHRKSKKESADTDSPGGAQ